MGIKYSFPALVFAVGGGALGQLFLKAGLIENQLTSDNFAAGIFQLSGTSLLFLASGLFLYAASMVAMIIALKRFELGFAYPLLALGYLIVYVGAFYWPGMNETVSLQKTTGVLLIIFGVTISAQTSSPGMWVHYVLSKKK